MTTHSEHAVVLGASMAGLVAARVLADFYERVTVVERDALPTAPVNRRGVPQGRLIHALSARGSEILDELFPGFTDELAESGVPSWDDGDFSRIRISVGGHRTVPSGTSPNAPAIAFPSRPLLEWQVRRRVRSLPNVTIRERHEVAALTSTVRRNRVTGVVVVDRGSDREATLAADLVVDATGRGSRAPSLLTDLGYGRPPEDELVVQLAYTCQLLRLPPGAVTEHFIAVFPEPGRPRMFGLVEYENDTWMFGVGAMAGLKPPGGCADMCEFAADFAPAHALDAIRDAEPLGDVCHHRVPSNRWRRYDLMRRFPQGFLILGDAICSFNPIYGQGMTVAAIEALLLRDCLARGDADLPRRFFRAAAKPIGVAWRTAVGSDLALPEVPGHRPLSMRISNAYLNWVLTAAETDPVAAGQFMRVTGMIDPPTRLLRPGYIARVAKAHRVRKANTPATPPRAVVTQGGRTP
ncbi:FAD-dependent oxidoreductase [Mycobacterium talmoniae]|uniref:2-polyprenyl-6-methoxyphenol hydroxylase-like oxidoreductase n=1 Tax=Mycobacterium talmoniae TaxID=1858794 RepID=A0A1S1NNU0_9MYCO|nr:MULTISPECIES: FAD-dependent monooxygenase [Mycobacterium]OHV06564.1 2-polyprenyl-6-methoxyphenol hydroxylase-like oxidoreductase [Mycobacterium talmoniae]TDH56093.1 FAD-binding protein [Mycobacterium eburneum]